MALLIGNIGLQPKNFPMKTIFQSKGTNSTLKVLPYMVYRSVIRKHLKIKPSKLKTTDKVEEILAYIVGTIIERFSILHVSFRTCKV